MRKSVLIFCNHKTFKATVLVLKVYASNVLFMSKVNFEKGSGSFHRQISVSCTVQDGDNVTTPHFPVSLKWLLTYFHFSKESGILLQKCNYFSRYRHLFVISFSHFLPFTGHPTKRHKIDTFLCQCLRIELFVFLSNWIYEFIWKSYKNMFVIWTME